MLVRANRMAGATRVPFIRIILAHNNGRCGYQFESDCPDLPANRLNPFWQNEGRGRIGGKMVMPLHILRLLPIRLHIPLREPVH